METGRTRAFEQDEGAEGVKISKAFFVVAAILLVVAFVFAMIACFSPTTKDFTDAAVICVGSGMAFLVTALITFIEDI